MGLFKKIKKGLGKGLKGFGKIGKKLAKPALSIGASFLPGIGPAVENLANKVLNVKSGNISHKGNTNSAKKNGFMETINEWFYKAKDFVKENVMVVGGVAIGAVVFFFREKIWPPVKKGRKR